jgi:hypothetical protein
MLAATAVARIGRWAASVRTPSQSSVRNRRLGPRVACSCTGGALATIVADAANEIASPTRAAGAPIAPTATPARPGPARSAVLLLSSSLELATVRSSGGTTSGRYDVEARPPTTVPTPANAAIPASCQIVRAPHA